MIDTKTEKLLQIIGRTGIASEAEILVESGRQLDFNELNASLKTLESEGLVRRVPGFYKGLGDALEVTRKGYKSL